MGYEEGIQYNTKSLVNPLTYVFLDAFSSVFLCKIWIQQPKLDYQYGSGSHH